MQRAHDGDPSRWTRLRALWPSGLAFALSLLLPGIHYSSANDANQTMSGAWAFGLGWFPALVSLATLPAGHFETLTTLAWFANPLLLMCWAFCVAGRRRPALACGVPALGLALLFLGCHTIPVPDLQTMHDVVPGWGYRLWLGSIAIAVAQASTVDDARVDAPPPGSR